MISDIRGVPGRDMLRPLAAGQRDPRALAELARGVMRRKLAALREALDCSFFTEQHAFALAMMLDNIDHYSAQIAALCEPYQRQIAQLDQIPGFGVRNAQDLIGEIGVDMTVFSTAGHLCSWARAAPRVKESGGRRKGGSATGKGSPYIGATLGEAAASAGRTQTFLGAKLRRLVRRMPKKKAQGTVMRTQLVIAHALLSDPEATYAELGPGYYDQRAGAQRQAHGHIRSLERLGCKVILEPVDPDTGELPAKAS